MDLVVGRGITEPSPIQKMALPRILNGDSCAIQSCTGSGKTLAYLMPALSRAMQLKQTPQAAGIRERHPLQVLVTVPSRELGMQILRVARELLPDDYHHLVQQAIGGANPKRQHEALRRHKPMLVVGTPGRILELVESGALQPERCPLLVLDEVDQLASSEFRVATDKIAKVVGSRLDRSTARQTVLVSASLSPHLLDRVKGWCPVEPEFISTSQLQGTAIGVNHDQEGDAAAELKASAQGGCLELPSTSGRHGGRHAVASKARLALSSGERHVYVLAEASKKLAKLHSSICAMQVQKALVFVSSQKSAIYVRQRLMEMRMQTTVLHGGLSKLERTNVTSAFQRGVFRVMVVTDMVSRGLDFPDLDAVFNLGLPETEVDYAHRAGRTNRLGGPEGKVVSILSNNEISDMERIASRLGITAQVAVVAFGEILLQQTDVQINARGDASDSRDRMPPQSHDGSEPREDLTEEDWLSSHPEDPSRQQTRRRKRVVVMTSSHGVPYLHL